ncbi:MAG: exopolysaccharide Pel transporter PelG [Magnetovibrionaceae bacterium]
MAGIGFVLRRLTQRDDLIGIAQGYAYSAMISAGPWVITILALSSINLFAGAFASIEDIATFRIIVIYNFAFSLVFSGPIILVVTRYLADRIYLREIQGAVGALFGSMLLLFVVCTPVVVGFYLWMTDLPVLIAIMGIWGFFLTTGVWLVNVYVSALKDYTAITRAFAFGLAVSAAATIWGSQAFGLIGMLVGFNLGLALIFFGLLARVFAEFPYLVSKPFAFLSYFRKYWELAAIGLLMNVALWIDKWIMWWAPEREVLAGFVFYSDYDSAMFLAYLTTIPSLALFMIAVETRFFISYQRFYADIQDHCSLKRMQENQQAIIDDILRSSRVLITLQGAIAAVTILAAPRIFDLFGISYSQLGIFRFGVLGAFFHTLIMYQLILLSYFDRRRYLTIIHTVLLVTNGTFTMIGLHLGFPFYGYGFFISTVVTVVIGFWLTWSVLSRLPFIAFLKSNDSLND